MYFWDAFYSNFLSVYLLSVYFDMLYWIVDRMSTLCCACVSGIYVLLIDMYFVEFFGLYIIILGDGIFLDVILFSWRNLRVYLLWIGKWCRGWCGWSVLIIFNIYTQFWTILNIFLRSFGNFYTLCVIKIVK